MSDTAKTAMVQPVWDVLIALDHRPGHDPARPIRLVEAVLGAVQDRALRVGDLTVLTRGARGLGWTFSPEEVVWHRPPTPEGRAPCAVISVQVADRTKGTCAATQAWLHGLARQMGPSVRIEIAGPVAVAVPLAFGSGDGRSV